MLTIKNSIQHYKTSIRKRIITKLLIILKNASKLLKENTQKLDSNTYTYLYKCISSILHNRDYIQSHCNDYRNTFHFACRQWYSYNNPGILT